MSLPTKAWSSNSAYAMAEERAERWRIRYETALEEIKELKEDD